MNPDNHVKTLNVTRLSKKLHLRNEAGKRACETPGGEFLRRRQASAFALNRLCQVK